MWLYICITLNLILNCDARVSVKLLQDQLRVMRESLSLDMRVIHAEIDSLREKLEMIEGSINATKAVSTDDKGAGIEDTKYQDHFVKELLDGLEKLETMKKNYEEYVILLRNGFKSLKTWNKESLKDLVQVFEERLRDQQQDYSSRLNTMQGQVESCTNEIKELQINTGLSDNQMTQALQEIKDTFTRKSEFHTQAASTETKVASVDVRIASTEVKLNEIQTELHELITARPKYQSKMDWSQGQAIFRAQARNGVNVYEAWTNGKGTTTAFPPENGKHYRNPAIDSWNNLDVKYVRLTLHDQNDDEVAFILFDGVRSDKMNWFAKHRILDSSWAQLNFDSSLNHCSISGDGQRKFYINARYGGCENDHGFINVLDMKNRGCRYERSANPPRFLYSEFPGGVRWDSRAYGEAEYMVIKIMK